MSVTGEVDITYPVFRRMALSFLGWRVVGGRILAGVAVVAFIAGSRSAAAIAIAVVLALILAGGPELGIWIAWELRREKVAGPNRFEVSPTAVDVHRRSGDLHVEWADVARVRRGRHSWSVRRAGLRELLIPREAFTAEDQNRVNDFFLAHPEFAG